MQGFKPLIDERFKLIELLIRQSLEVLSDQVEQPVGGGASLLIGWGCIGIAVRAARNKQKLQNYEEQKI